MFVKITLKNVKNVFFECMKISTQYTRNFRRGREAFHAAHNGTPQQQQQQHESLIRFALIPSASQFSGRAVAADTARAQSLVKFSLARDAQ